MYMNIVKNEDKVIVKEHGTNKMINSIQVTIKKVREVSWNFIRTRRI